MNFPRLLQNASVGNAAYDLNSQRSSHTKWALLKYSIIKQFVFLALFVQRKNRQSGQNSFFSPFVGMEWIIQIHIHPNRKAHAYIHSLLSNRIELQFNMSAGKSICCACSQRIKITRTRENVSFHVFWLNEPIGQYLLSWNCGHLNFGR